MATKNKNTLPTPVHVQAIVDALEAIKPAHWTARHGDGSASGTWMVFSEVFRGRIDDLKQQNKQGRGGYRVGIQIETVNGQLETCFYLYDNPIAAQQFKAGFRHQLLQPLKDRVGARNIECGSVFWPEDKSKSSFTIKRGMAGAWIDHWLTNPRYFDETRLMSFTLAVGVLGWASTQELVEEAPGLADAYLPLLECMVSLDGEPIDPRRTTRYDRLRPNLARVTGPAERCGCEHRRIDGLDSAWQCAGRLEAAHIKPFQQGGSDEPSNGLWLCHVHHCETEGRVAGNRLSVRLLDHIPQTRHSRSAFADL